MSLRTQNKTDWFKAYLEKYNYQNRCNYPDIPKMRSKVETYANVLCIRICELLWVCVCERVRQNERERERRCRERGSERVSSSDSKQMHMLLQIQ